MDFDQSSPIFTQIATTIKQRVVSGEWPPGAKVAPVRELAVAFGVNPNTMQRALSELEREGVLAAERTAGRYVTGDETLIAALRRDMAARETQRYLTRLKRMGYTRAQAAELICAIPDSTSDNEVTK